jgi:hypothetical protein
VKRRSTREVGQYRQRHGHPDPPLARRTTEVMRVERARTPVSANAKGPKATHGVVSPESQQSGVISALGEHSASSHSARYGCDSEEGRRRLRLPGTAPQITSKPRCKGGWRGIGRPRPSSVCMERTAETSCPSPRRARAPRERPPSPRCATRE